MVNTNLQKSKSKIDMLFKGFWSFDKTKATKYNCFAVYD